VLKHEKSGDGLCDYARSDWEFLWQQPFALEFDFIGGTRPLELDVSTAELRSPDCSEEVREVMVDQD